MDFNFVKTGMIVLDFSPLCRSQLQVSQEVDDDDRELRSSAYQSNVMIGPLKYAAFSLTLKKLLRVEKPV